MSLTTYAEENLNLSKRLDKHIASQDLPLASFYHDTLTDLPPELQEAQAALVDVTHSLKRLAQASSPETHRVRHGDTLQREPPTWLRLKLSPRIQARSDSGRI